MSQEEREERKKERRREGGSKDPRKKPLTFIFYQVHPLASTGSCGEAGLQRKGKSAEQGNAREKSTEVRPVGKVDLCRVRNRADDSSEVTKDLTLGIWDGITFCQTNPSPLILPLVAMTSLFPVS